MRSAQKTITGGLYLVIDPCMKQKLLLDKLKRAIAGGIQVVQIWNNWPAECNKLLFIKEIAGLCRPHQIPLLINEEWALLAQTNDLDGIHFDAVPSNISSIRETIDKPIITGITCSGNLEIVRWANAHGMDYISFCSMFPSPSAGSCDLVMPETVRMARTLTNLPVFVSGGITPENALALKQQIPFNGVAVISGLLSADNPTLQAQAYQKAINI